MGGGGAELYSVTMFYEALNALRTTHSTIPCRALWLVHKCSQPSVSANKEAIKMLSHSSVVLLFSALSAGCVVFQAE